jgi:integrase
MDNAEKKYEKRKVSGSDVKSADGRIKAHLSAREIGGRTVYQMNISIKGQRRLRPSTGETAMIAALAKLKQEVVRLENGSQTGAVAFGDFIERYLDQPTCKGTPAPEGRRNRGWFFKTLVDHFGGEAVKDKASGLFHFSGGPFLSSFTSEAVDSYVAERSKKVGPGCMNREIGSLKGLFRKAMEQRILRENPVQYLKFHSEVGTERQRFLEIEEVDRLLNAAKSLDLRAFIMILANTGARPGEIRNARWRDVRITDERCYLTVGRAKNGRGRIIRLSERSRKALLEWRSELKPELGQYLFPPTKHSKSGKPYDFTGPFRKAVKEAKLNRPGEEEVTQYHLRHFNGSSIHRTGADYATGMKLMGHKDYRSHQRYIHFYESDLDSAADALERVISQNENVTKNVTNIKTGGTDEVVLPADLKQPVEVNNV